MLISDFTGSFDIKQWIKILASQLCNFVCTECTSLAISVIHRENLVFSSDAGKLRMFPSNLAGVNDTDETELNHTKTGTELFAQFVIGDQFISGFKDGYDQLSGRLIRNKTKIKKFCDALKYHRTKSTK